jgi:PTS system nitrogen regulatory IIA component
MAVKPANLSALLAEETVVLHQRHGQPAKVYRHLAELLLSPKPLPSLVGEVEKAIAASLEAGRGGYIQDGVAVAALALESAVQPKAAFLLQGRPLLLNAADGQPVDMFMAILLPEASASMLLQWQALASRVFRTVGIKEKLRGCDSAAAAYILLTQREADIAA